MKAKYEYLLCVWGGFWNPWNKAIHNEPETPYRWFDTKEERDAELDRLRRIAKELGTLDACIANRCSEGYLTRYQHVVYALVKDGDSIIETENNLGYGFFSDEEMYERDYGYWLDEKWDSPDDEAKLLFSTLILKP
jgi:hypothetical protein